MRRYLLIATIFSACTGVSSAQVPDISSVSDDALAKVRTEISDMTEPELRALLSYVAECGDRKARDAVAMQSCRSARLRYQTEFGGGRAIDAAIDASEKLTELTRLISGGVAPATIEVDTTIRSAVREALQARRAGR